MEKETQIKEYAECALTWLGEIQDNEKAVKHIDHFIRQVIAWADTTPMPDAEKEWDDSEFKAYAKDAGDRMLGLLETALNELKSVSPWDGPEAKRIETRIAEAVKRERARILDVARNWTGCKYCSTGETLKELVHPAPSNEGEG